MQGTLQFPCGPPNPHHRRIPHNRHHHSVRRELPLLGLVPGRRARRKDVGTGARSQRSQPGTGRTEACLSCRCYSPSVEAGRVVEGGRDRYLVRESGWGVRRMADEEAEMRRVAYVQAQAFHVPLGFLDDLFFHFFQAEVLSALMHRVRNSPPNRDACLVAEPEDESNMTSSQRVVGVADVTVQRDNNVLRYLDGENEFLYVSGIAVLKEYRRMKVGSSLLKACEALSEVWGFRCLVLRAYDDDLAALQLYTKQGYEIVSGDPKWMTTWIGRRRRVLMVKFK